MVEILAAGTRACVHSLQSRPELNGEIVTLASWDGQAMRWVCRLADGGRVALREANLQPVRTRRGAAPLGTDPNPPPAWLTRVRNLPWAHFVGGLAVTLLVGYLARMGTDAGPRPSPTSARQPRAQPKYAYTGPDLAAYGVGVVSWVPLVLVIVVAGLVWAIFVDAGGGAQGTPLQQQVRRACAHVIARVVHATGDLSAFHMLLLSSGAMLSWALWTDQLRLNLDMTRLIFLPVIGYTLWRSRGQLHNMNPFQLLWILDMLMRMFQPGGGRSSGGAMVGDTAATVAQWAVGRGCQGGQCTSEAAQSRARLRAD
eukprot:CAMPEP_0206043280 /NCGR_PEP_ID=MMETSP1466-20131121/8483_1 /ASSEMBLY_ACC=CAM_ASM_001126 /TAXON_ID=44452 /ORGANISM="Pavlova gyrans, Strain CCMP608" /LENGTH=312 /DNA_ID=CAMNT_0053418075 /DNA_START=20 /DNA_END=959 /DNA_ORIENTATION=+